MLLRYVPSQDEVRRVIEGLNPRWPSNRRNRALLGLLYGAGLRCREALGLRLADVDLEARRVVVRRGKGGKARVSGILPEAVEWIRPYFEERLRRARSRSEPLFVSRDGSEVDPSYVRRLCRRLGARAGLPRLHPHALRHAHAVRLARAGLHPAYVQRQLGHSNLRTTDVYLSGLLAEEAIEAVAALS